MDEDETRRQIHEDRALLKPLYNTLNVVRDSAADLIRASRRESSGDAMGRYGVTMEAMGATSAVHMVLLALRSVEDAIVARRMGDAAAQPSVTVFVPLSQHEIDELINQAVETARLCTDDPHLVNMVRIVRAASQTIPGCKPLGLREGNLMARILIVAQQRLAEMAEPNGGVDDE